MSERHRTALISDLHANAIALREVLRSIEALGVDEIACLGDVATIGIAPGEVIDTLQALGCRCIMGNHDDSVASKSRAAPVTITSRIHRRSVERSETSSRSSRTSEAFGLGLD